MIAIKKLKNLFNKYDLDGYIVPKNDEFFGEYIPETKDNLKFISNFSGSYGFALILKKNNYLFVDGRYTLQAKIQSGKFYKILTIPNTVPYNIVKNKKLKIGFDPRLHTESAILRIFQNTDCKLIPLNENLINKIWRRKNEEKTSKFYMLNDKDSGQSSQSKIEKLFKILKKNKANSQFISAPENVAWLLNLRGGDSEYAPIPNSYLVLNEKKEVYFFCDLKKINIQLKKKLNKIIIKDINLIKPFFLNMKNMTVLLDSTSCSIFF